VVIVLCLTAVIFPFITGISILEGIKRESEISIQEGADVYVSGDSYGSNGPISTRYVSAIKSLDGVMKVFPRVVGRAYFFNKLVTVVGVNRESFPASLNIIQGRIPQSPGEVLMGQALARQTGLQVGTRFSFVFNPAKLFRVTGIFTSKCTIWSALLTCMSFEDAQELFRTPGMATDILVYTRPGYAEAVAEKLQEKERLGGIKLPFLRVQHRRLIRLYIVKGFNTRGGVFTALYTVAFALGIPALLVASGLGFTERRREIGILKATGWQTQEVLETVFLENSMLSLLATSVAVLVSYGWLKVLNGFFIAQFFIAEVELMPYFPVPSRFFPMPCLLGLLISFIITSVGSIYTTWRTAVTAPTEAIR
jgi:ABC-type lipoprotein release transport system permease subunit